MRNITGTVSILSAGNGHHWISGWGAFCETEEQNDVPVAEAAKSPNSGVAGGFSIDASRSVATSAENRPSAISVLPLIAY